MSIWGIGKYLFFEAILYIIAVMILEQFYPNVFSFPSNIISQIVGLLFVLMGLLFLIGTLRTFRNKFRKGELLASGTYSLCRNPMYASWIIFLVPGISLLRNSWLMLTTSLFMYIMFKFHIKKEESFLSEKFGQEYSNYKNSVNQLFPFPKRK